MLQKTLLQDSSCKGNCNCNCITPEDAYDAYRRAAESDEYLFGDYDQSKDWMNDIEGLQTLFFMEITIYTSQGCVWCSRMKELMQRANQEYTEVLWQSLPGEEQVKIQQKYPDVSSFPIAIIDGEFVGGLVPVAKLFLEKGLVSSNKK